MINREYGKLALKKVLNIQKNIDVIEKYIFTNSKTFEEYKRNIYQIIGDIINKDKINDILSDIKSKKLGWNHKTFYNFSESIKEQNNFIINPFEIEEGVFTCKSINPETGLFCGSKRVFSYSKQDRSCDEGTSVYAQCFVCKSKWRERG